ncbi:Bacterial alpha-L-rhamnosidase [Planctomycetes bacterium MalM25]|nr:Bacterial alpha-L-rhamnosidase [Planctomycetes bacterium MalM25]
MLPVFRIHVLVLTLVALAPASPPLAGDEPGEWNTQWIWQEQAGPANTWMAFRKEFHVTKAPEQAIARIAVDSKYWLWVNGEQVLFEGGIARGPRKGNTFYEQVDLAPYLQEGDNTIALLVWHFGRTRKAHADSGQGGLVLQADLGDTMLKTDRSWKVKHHPAYDPASGGGGNDRQIPQYNIKYDARKSLGDWTDSAWYTPGYDDSSWQDAVEKGCPPASPWNELELNYVPHLNDRGLVNYEDYPESKFPFTSDGSVIRCKLPFNQQVTPYFKVVSPPGKSIRVRLDNRVNRISTTYRTRSGSQAFESYAWVNGHYVEYQIPKGVVVNALKYRWTGVGEMKGKFACSDPALTRLWWMARNTLYVCARDGYMDCPDRERGLWIGDVADQCGPVFYTLDDAGRQLLKKAIRTTVGYSEDGIIAGLAPGLIDELPMQSLQFIDQGIWRYYHNTGDSETLAYAYPLVREYLQLWGMEPNGMPSWREGRTAWADWGEGVDPPPTQVCWYVLALQAAKRMATELGHSSDLTMYEERLEAISANFDKLYWNGKYYTSGEFKDDRANALAILAGLARPSHYNSIMEEVLIPVRGASPHMEWIVEEAMVLAGAPEEALRRMRERYQSQIDNDERTTLDEYLGVRDGGTYNHAWNAPNYILSKYVAGLAPDSPGWESYHVFPRLLDLTSVEQLVPSVQGEIAVRMNLGEGTFSLELSSPVGTVARVGIPKSIGRVSRVSANQHAVWLDGEPLGGIEGVRCFGENDDYLVFTVAPGEWNLTATTDQD